MQPGRGEHERERGKQPADAPGVEAREREGAGFAFRKDDGRDQEAGNHEEHVDADVAAPHEHRRGVVADDCEDGERPHPVDVGPVGDRSTHNAIEAVRTRRIWRAIPPPNHRSRIVPTLRKPQRLIEAVSMGQPLRTIVASTAADSACACLYSAMAGTPSPGWPNRRPQVEATVRGQLLHLLERALGQLLHLLLQPQGALLQRSAAEPLLLVGEDVAAGLLVAGVGRAGEALHGRAPAEHNGGERTKARKCARTCRYRS